MAGNTAPTFLSLGGKYRGAFHTLDDPAAMAIQSDGKIVVVGDTEGWREGPDTVWSWDMRVVRFSPDGTADTTFSQDGTQTTDFNGEEDFARAVAVQADGRILVAGQVRAADGSAYDFGLVRYNADGTLA